MAMNSANQAYVCEHCGQPIEQQTYWKHVGDTVTFSQAMPPPTVSNPIFINYHQIVPVAKSS
jgi:hypothetical protein